MADNTNKSSIDDIVSGVRKTLESGIVSDSSLSFEFVDECGDSPALVFEDAECEEAPLSDCESNDPSQADTTEKNENQEDDNKEEEKAKRERVASASIWTTYVPKFTEVSETYRMKSGEKASREPLPTVKKDKESPILIPEEIPEMPVDPTAEPECESGLSGITLVTSGNSLELGKDDVATVFKFDSDINVPKEQPIGAESEAISEALGEIEEVTAELSGQKQEIEENTEKERNEQITNNPEPQDPKSYVMPDPVSHDAKVNLPAPKQATAVETLDEAVRKRKHSEYSSFSEKDGFYDSFIDSIMSVRVRIVSVIIFSLMLLLLENLSFFGIDLIKLMHFEGVGGAMAILTLPFVAAIFLLAMPEVVYSFVALSRKKLVPEVFLTVSFAAIVFYYAIVITFAVKDDYSIFGFLFAVLVLLSLFSSYYKKKADFEAFRIVSVSGEKKVVDRKLTRNLPAEHRALDGKIESFKSRTARVFRTNFVSDFSARSSIISENTQGNVIILFVTLGIALVSGIIAFFIPGGIVRAAMTFAVVYMFALPSFALITHKIPFYQATAEAKRENSAIIGEKTLYDYSGIDVITFDDTEIFGKDDVNLQRIMVYGRKENLPKALQQMSALFTVVGGPLAYIFANAVDRRVSPADNVAVDTDGVIGAIDGVEIMAGNAEFMESHGVRIPYDPEGDGQASQTTRIMYAAESGEIYAKFYVRYMLSEEFTMILPILMDEAVKPLVYTRDPNINDSLFRSLTAGKDSIRVLKKQNLPSSEMRRYSRISLGMVTLGDKTNVVNTILLSKKYAAFQARFALAELPAMIGGAMIGLLLAICVSSPISSLLISLWYVGWSTAVILLGKRFFGRKKEKNKDKED